MEAALQGFSPASAWGVGRVVAGEGPGPRGWADVGGLEDVRDALRETLELPTRYAKLIARYMTLSDCDTILVEPHKLYLVTSLVVRDPRTCC